MARVFFALWPDDECAARLHGLAEESARRFGGRAMRRETLHLTLAFVGEVREEKIPELLQLGDAVSAETAGAVLDFSLNRLGVWPQKRILWAGSDDFPPQLEILAEKLLARLNERAFKLPLRPFTPHVTLLRKLGALPDSGVHDALQQTPQAWHASEFVLLRSQRSAAGATYETLASWKPCALN